MLPPVPSAKATVGEVEWFPCHVDVGDRRDEGRGWRSVLSANVLLANVTVEASGPGGEVGCGLLRGWYRVWRGTRTSSGGNTAGGRNVGETGDDAWAVEVAPLGLEMDRAAPTGGDDELILGDATAMCAMGGPDESNDMTVVGFVLASEFWRDLGSSEVVEVAQPIDENVSRRSGTNGGLEPGTRRGIESERISASEPKRVEMIDMERVGDGGMGRTLASSSA